MKNFNFNWNTPTVRSTGPAVIVEGFQVNVFVLPENRISFLETDTNGNDIYSFEFMCRATTVSPYNRKFKQKPHWYIIDRTDSPESVNADTLKIMLSSLNSVMEQRDNEKNISENEKRRLSAFKRVDVYRYTERMENYLELNSLGCDYFYVPRSNFGKNMTTGQIDYFWARLIRVERAFVVYKVPLHLVMERDSFGERQSFGEKQSLGESANQK